MAMATKSFFSTLVVIAAALLIACAIIPSGHEASGPRSQLKKDGELPLPVDYRKWNKFLPTVERADKEEIREIYINGPGMKGTAPDGFPNGTTFVMEIFSAKRGSLILMPNEKVLSDYPGGWHVEIYVKPKSSLLPTDATARCRPLSEGCGWSFVVKDRAVDTGIHVPKGVTVQVLARGAVLFDRRFSPVGPDGTKDATPATFPAPALRKHSLICKVGDSEWLQCGTSMSFTPEGHNTLLRTPAGQLVKGKLQGLYLMQKGPNWGRESDYETGDWVFDHYRPLVGQFCTEELGISLNGSLRCVTGLDISLQHEKVGHENWSRDCRRCHVPVMQEAGSHDRDFVYGYKEHFEIYSSSEKKRLYTSITK
jgi:hypothetical protein